MTDRWQERAACRDHDPHAWFAEGGYLDYSVARAICVKDCQVREACLQFALDNPLLTAGMYGGHTPNERRALRRHRKPRT